MSEVPWLNTPHSDSRLNKMTVPILTGAEIAALDKSLHRLVICRSTGSGFTVDHVYLANTAADAWIDLSSVSSHTHTDSTTGGSIASIFDANWLYTDLFLSRTTDLVKAAWIQTVTGTGSIEDATDGTTGERSIRLRPNATSGSGSTISYPHISLDFSKNAYYETKVRIETATSLAFHTGVNADDVTAADSNTRKFNAEVCTTTNSNWFLRTANGTTNSTSDTGVAISTSRTWLYIAHLPSVPETDLYLDDNTVFQKTTHIPVDQSSAHINLIKHSIKNSTGADRPIHIYPTRVKYFMTDKWA
jgi:hypothetical protein